MSLKQKVECCTCAYWQRDGADGICRRDCPTPRIMPAGEKYTLVWPRTDANERCGEWLELVE
jgi:hypothetical protein